MDAGEGRCVLGAGAPDAQRGLRPRDQEPLALEQPPVLGQQKPRHPALVEQLPRPAAGSVAEPLAERRVVEQRR